MLQIFRVLQNSLSRGSVHARKIECLSVGRRHRRQLEFACRSSLEHDLLRSNYRGVRIHDGCIRFETDPKINGIECLFCGSPAWIRTTIHGSKGRCPTIRRPGKMRTHRFLSLTCPDRSPHRSPQSNPGRLQYATRKPILAGAGHGLQTRCAALRVAGGFDPHWLPPCLPSPVPQQFQKNVNEIRDARPSDLE